MTYFQLKEANRLYWMVKGQLIPLSWSDEEILSIYKSYTKRVWGNHETHIHESGFEVAWSMREVSKAKKMQKK